MGKKGNGSKSDMIITKQITRPCVTDLPEKDLRALAENLATLLGEKDDIEAAKKSAVADFNNDIEAVESRISVAAKTVRDGGPETPTECTLEINLETNLYRVTRNDVQPRDSRFLVEERALNADERAEAMQGEMKWDPEHDGAASEDSKKVAAG